MFNTLKYATMMEEVGFSRNEAETSVKIWVEIMEDNLASKQDMLDLAAATKQDLKDHAAATKLDMQELKNELKHDMQELKQNMLGFRAELKQEFLEVRREMQACELRLTVRMGAVAVATIGILTAIQKLV